METLRKDDRNGENGDTVRFRLIEEKKVEREIQRSAALDLFIVEGTGEQLGLGIHVIERHAKRGRSHKLHSIGEKGLKRATVLPPPLPPNDPQP